MILPRLLLLCTLYQLSECGGCPAACTCPENAVLCMKNELLTIPNFENLNNTPTIIDLSGNKLNDIGPDDLSFDKSYFVKEMYLNNSEVFDINYEAFDELENLQQLYLGENLLNSIPADFIEDLPDIVLLDLSGNQFSINMPIIKSTSLEVLALANSKVTNVPADVLRYLPNLKMLLLQQNNIKYIDLEVFEALPTKINFSVRLSYNPWECDCNTIRLFEYLAKKNYTDAEIKRYHCLTTAGAYFDIFYQNTMEVNSSLCVESHESRKLSPSRKRSSQIIEANNEKERELIGRNQDKFYSLIKEDGSMEVDSITNETNDNLEIVVCHKQNRIILGLQLGTNEILLIILSFLIGIFIGFSVHQCLAETRRKRLDTSDSTTKLIM